MFCVRACVSVHLKAVMELNVSLTLTVKGYGHLVFMALTWCCSCFHETKRKLMTLISHHTSYFWKLPISLISFSAKERNIRYQSWPSVTSLRCHYLFKSRGGGHLCPTQCPEEEHGPRGGIHPEPWTQVQNKTRSDSFKSRQRRLIWCYTLCEDKN